MIDIYENKHLQDLAQENISLAKDYLKARTTFAEAKLYIDLQIALNIEKLRAKRSNIGYDMALLEIVALIGNSGEIKGYYSDYVIQRNRYKGLEKVINAISSKISLGQSLIKNKIQESL